PARLRPAYRTALAEVHKYVRYILKKVWERRLGEAGGKGAAAAEAQDIVDDIVHIVLPHTKRILDDVLFGTGETHLRLTMPKRGVLARTGLASVAPSAKDPAQAAQQAVAMLGGRAECDLNDQLEQALVEDIDDFVQKHVERALGLPLRGR